VANVAEKVAELHELIRKQYGLKADISISIHSIDNEHLCQGSAFQIGLAMSRSFNEKTKVKHSSGDKSSWVRVEPPYDERVSISLFYKN